MAEADTIYIGKKATMNYVLAIVTQFHGGSNQVLIRARGRSISRAVDVAELVRNRFLPGSKVKGVRIFTDKVSGEDGQATSVSAIEIAMTK